MTNSKKTTFLRSWVINNSIVYPLSLGILHPLISHGFLGDHGIQLTVPQFIMHTFAIVLFSVLLTIAQNKALRLLNINCKPLNGSVYMSLLIPLFFWTGYYTFYIPFDILFMMLTVGAINAIRLRPYMTHPGKWIWQSMLTYFIAAVVAIGCGFAAFYAGVLNLQHLVRDLVLWLFISIPAGIVVALISKVFLKQQIEEVSSIHSKVQALDAVRIGEVRRPAKAV